MIQSIHPLTDVFLTEIRSWEMMVMVVAAAPECCRTRDLRDHRLVVLFAFRGRLLEAVAPRK